MTFFFLFFFPRCIKEWKIHEKNIEFAAGSNFSLGSDNPLTANNPISTEISSTTSLETNKLRKSPQPSWKMHFFPCNFHFWKYIIYLMLATGIPVLYPLISSNFHLKLFYFKKIFSWIFFLLNQLSKRYHLSKQLGWSKTRRSIF